MKINFETIRQAREISKKVTRRGTFQWLEAGAEDNLTTIANEKFLNSIKSTNFSNLKNKEFNEGFEESVYSNKTGKKINFFNLGFNNRWQKLLPTDIKDLLNKHFIKELKELNYFNG